MVNNLAIIDGMNNNNFINDYIPALNKQQQTLIYNRMISSEMPNQVNYFEKLITNTVRQNR